MRALQVPLREKKFEEALERWYGLRTQDEVFKRGLGYHLYDGLMAVGKQDLAEKVLDELIASAVAELKVTEKQSTQLAERLNELAWLYALRGKNLEEAKKYAIEAVRIVRERRRENVWVKLFPNAQARLEESQYLNTRGWVELQLLEDELAIKYLAEAAELAPIGSNLLYLALAHDALGEEDAAREVAGKAHSAGDLSLYESRLLEELRERLVEF
jgi:tetratricopeptide (TPR) repeat protein